MENIYITMNENGDLTCSDPNGGYIEEMKARQLVISVSSFFRSSVISYFTISFEPYGLGKKIVTDNIYKSSNTGDAKYTALTGTITCPIYDYIAVSPKVSMQIDGYETDENDNICAIYKSGILDLHFSESLVGDKIIPDTTNAQQKLDEKISSMISEELNALVVSSQQIANSAVTNGKIASGAVSADKISNSAVTSLKIAENAVINSRIADGSISAGKIAGGAVETSKIKGYAVTDAKLASEAVTTAKIKDKAILSGKIADGQVKTINIADEAVTDEKLGNAAVTEGKIKNAAVTVNKIASNAVTTSKINDGAVLRNKLGDGQVSTAKLENGAVTEDKLSSGAVTTAKIGTAQVTEAKLSTEVQEKLNSIPDLSELDIGSLNDGEFAVHYPLQGKKLSIIGDSISTFEGYIPSGYSHFYPQQNNDITSVNQTWWKQLANETKLTILKNCSWSGSFVTNDPNNPISTAKCASTDARINDLADGNTTPDIVICQIGVNDFRYNSEDSDSRLIPLGSYDGTTVLPAEANISTFSEAYGLMLKKVMSTYPNAKVYCCTLLEAGSVSFDSNDSGEKIFPCVRGEDGASLASFNDRIRTLAKNMGAKLIDLHDCGINYWNLTTYTHDKVHPNADGAKLLKDKIKSELLSGTITLADVSDNEVIPSNYVTTDTAQTVSGTKTFTGNNGNLSIENGEISGSPLSKSSHIKPSQVSVHELEGSNASDLKTHHTKLDGKNGFVHQISDLSTGNDFSGSMVTSVNNGSPETKIVLKKGSNQSCEYKLPGFSAGASKTLVTVDEIPTALSDLTDDLGSSPTHTHSQYLTSHQDISGKADIADVPTALSELSDDSTHRLVTDSEKSSWNNKAAQVIPEKVYFVEESEGSAPSEPAEIDITSRLTYHGTYYINAAGVPTSSATNHCFKCDLSAYTPTQIKTATRSTSWYSYAFYSSDSVFDSATLISGGHNASASNGQGTMNYEVFNIGSIPNNAVTLLVVRYTDFDDAVANFFVKGYDLNDSSDDSGISTDSVSGCIEQWKSDNYPDAVIYKPTGISTHVYRVGSGRTYATLKAAVAQWVTDGKPCATIYVDSGIYTTTSDPSASSNELLIKGAENRLTIIGEDRDSTIVKSTTGKYIHPAINIQGGNVTVKNITFIADHSANSSFVYLDPDRAAQNKSPNSAYAVHCDGGSEADVVSGVIEFENCNMWSWQSCGLGCGTVVNGHVIVKNCDIRSFVPGKVTDEGDASGTAEQQEAHAIYVHGSRGAIVYHSSPKTKNGTTVVSSNESFTMVDTRVYLKGGTKTLSIEDNNKENFFDLVLFKNNNFSNGVESSNIAPVPNTVTLNALSAGNNISTLNSNGNGYSLILN